MCGLALGAVILTRGREVWRLRWSPNRDTGAAVVAALGASALSAILLLLPPDHVASRIILYGGIF